MEFWPDVLSNLIGAGVGAFLGYLFGVRQERKIRKDEEKEIKKYTIESILLEIERNEHVLGDEAVLVINRDRDRKIPFTTNALTTSSFQSVVFSGRFSLISPINQISLSEYNEECKRIMNKVKIVESTFRISNEYIEIYRNEIIEMGKPLLDLIIDIKNELNSELK